MKQIYGLLLTLIAGLFFLIGGFISLKVKNKNKLNNFSIAVSFIIMLSLILFDLTPEIGELIEGIKKTTSIPLIIISTIFGLGFLKILDLFIPCHSHNHSEEHDDEHEHITHIKHIGTLTIISLILHNILEGFAIYGIALTNLKVGILTSLSVALHNIPLGTGIFSSLNIKQNKTYIIALTLSSLIGGIIGLLFGNISNLVLAIITSITLGMVLYIALFELLKEVIVNLKKKETIYGLITGLIILIISSII